MSDRFLIETILRFHFRNITRGGDPRSGHGGGLKEKFRDRPKLAGPIEYIDGGTRTSFGRSPNAHPGAGPCQ